MLRHDKVSKSSLARIKATYSSRRSSSISADVPVLKSDGR
jgi:hypothetical protein